MKNIKDVRILVVGDIMLDKYVVGDVERISPEAPVPVVHVKKEYHTLGGCGNVVKNLTTLGAKVDCFAAIGRDENGTFISHALKRIGVRKSLIVDGGYQTIVKERIIADHRKVQMLRIDRESKGRKIDARRVEYSYRDRFDNKYDIVIVSDYAKGMITPQLMDMLKTIQDADIIVDPKPINGYMYNDVFLLTPNAKEWGSMLMQSSYQLRKVPFVLETKGQDGMTLHYVEEMRSVDIKSTPVEVFNVSGAGDTVIAVMGACLSMGHGILESACVANVCAGHVVTKPGTSTVPENIFKNAVDSLCEGKV